MGVASISKMSSAASVVNCFYASHVSFFSAKVSSLSEKLNTGMSTKLSVPVATLRLF